LTSEPGILAEHNGWRLIDGGPDWDSTRVEIQRPDGTWFWPDCSFGCEHCDVCLGCARKMVHGHMQEWAESSDDTAMLEMEMDCASLYGARCAGSKDGRHVPREAE
jgi:hypothetical protein